METEKQIHYPSEVMDVMDARARLTSLEEEHGAVWIGRDIAIKENTIINPQAVTTSYLTVSKEDLPPLTITRGVFGCLSRSVRSFYAQTGIDIQLQRMSVSDEMIATINEGGSASIPVTIINNGQRAVEIEGSVMRFFFADDTKRLRGDKLTQCIASGEIAIAGEAEQDWYFGFAEDETGNTITKESQHALCIVVPLSAKRFYIPFDPTPVKKDPQLGTRENLSRLLVEIPPGALIDFEVRETPCITLGNNTVAVINLGGASHGGTHITSPLIDPGFSGPIRTETIHGLKQIDLFFMQLKSR